MIGCKYTHNVRSLPSSTNGNEHRMARGSEFIKSRENFTRPTQETDPIAAKELVC